MSDHDSITAHPAPVAQAARLPACPLCSAASVNVIDATAGLLACGSCGFIFAHPCPSDAALEAYYSQFAKYDDWIAHENERDRVWRRRLDHILRHRRKGRLLDISTGTGQFLKHAREHFEVTGTEISDSAIAVAKERYGLAVMKGSVDKGLLGDSRFDVITLFHVLEHVADPGALVAACRRILDDKGILVIAVPNEIRSVRRRARGALKFLLGAAGIRRFRGHGRLGIPRIALDGTQDEIHLSFFTQKTLVRLLESRGFTIAETSLDVPFIRSGWRGVSSALGQAVLSALHRLTGCNIYEAIWVVARKRSSGSDTAGPDVKP